MSHTDDARLSMLRGAGCAIDRHPIEPLLARIREQLRPEQVWLFGSRARGDARPTSDWDLFVVVPDDTDEVALDPMEIWKLKRGLRGIYADVIACRSQDFAEWKDTVNTLSYAVAREGRLLYER